jgi:hypothetical protein
MIFEFVIVYERQDGVSITALLRDRLKEVLLTNGTDVDDESIARMVWLNFERSERAKTDEVPAQNSRSIASFVIDVELEQSLAEVVIDNFVDAIKAAPVNHVCIFENPLLREELAKRANELFSLEMKLRRVLSVIYLHACAPGSEYDLLREESVSPMTKDLQVEQMQRCCENEFFHITFSDYKNLNTRPDPKQIMHLLEHIRSQTSYEALRSELTRRPIVNDEDADLIASLKEWMDPIEKMRNCVAHNRKPSKKLTSDYETALGLINQELDSFLCRTHADWLNEVSPEMPWETHAREAVEKALEDAEWNEEEHVIKFRDRDEPRISETVSNRDELVAYLERLAESESANYAPWDEGEPVFSADVDTIVQDALADYERRIEQFFADRADGEQAKEDTGTVSKRTD